MGRYTQLAATVVDRLDDLGKTIEAIKLVVEHTSQVPLLEDSPGTAEAHEIPQTKEYHPNKVQLGREVSEKQKYHARSKVRRRK